MSFLTFRSAVPKHCWRYFTKQFVSFVVSISHSNSWTLWKIVHWQSDLRAIKNSYKLLTSHAVIYGVAERNRVQLYMSTPKRWYHFHITLHIVVDKKTTTTTKISTTTKTTAVSNENIFFSLYFSACLCLHNCTRPSQKLVSLSHHIACNCQQTQHRRFQREHFLFHFQYLFACCFPPLFFLFMLSRPSRNFTHHRKGSGIRLKQTNKQKPVTRKGALCILTGSNKLWDTEK